MDKNSLQQFVSNMRNSGSDDDTIAQELQKAGHNEDIINELLGRGGDDTAPAEAVADDAPIIDPNNRPQIVKDRSAVLKEQIKEEGGEAPEAAESTPAPSSRSKVEVKPQTEGLEPAAINSPSTSQAPQEDEAPKPTHEVAEEPAAPNPIPPAAPVIQGMPAVGEHAPAPTEAPAASPIYPDATRGHSAHMQPHPHQQHPHATPAHGAAPAQHYPEYMDNPLQLAGYSFSSFFKYFPQMIFASIMGIILAVVFIFVMALVFGLVVNALGDSTASGLGVFGGLGGGIAIAIIGTILYAAFIATYISLYRTLQLSLALDIAKGDKPDIGGAFSKMFGFFGRIFMANLRLIIKLILVAIVFVLVVWAVAFALFSGSNSLDGLGAALIFAGIAYISLLVIIATILLRNSFIHLLMLDNSANTAANSARDSVALMKNPRRKHLDIFTWILIIGAVNAMFYLFFVLVTPYDYSGADFYSSGNGFNTIGAVLFSIISILLFTVFDIGLARQFHASNGQVRSAAHGPKFNILVIPILIGAFALTIGLYWTASSIDDSRFQEAYELRQEERQRSFDDSFDSFDSSSGSSSIDEFDFNDWDRNGIVDSEQCGVDQFASPTFVEYDDDFNAIYEIECIEF